MADDSNEIFCLGPSGTFSSRAAQAYLNGKQGKLRLCSSIAEVFSALIATPFSSAVIPIENTIAGVVGLHQDLLLDYHKKYGVKIVGEVDFSVEFTLVANTQELSQVSLVYAHPHAFEQCQLFSATHFHKAETHFTKSTTEAGQTFLKALEQEKTGFFAAFIPTLYAKETASFHPYIIKDLLIDQTKKNVTRFLVVQNNPKLELDFGKTKTSIYVETQKDEPALLYKILNPFAALNINLNFLHSRSDHNRTWNYNFFIDFYNSQTKQGYSEVCLDILKTMGFIKVFVLGTYDSLLKKE